MDSIELKDKMMKLWKKIFHDSDAYISLVFDNYFNEDNVEYYEEDGKLVSALLGIPYNFSNGKKKIRGLYLCGLATDATFRHRGIMHNLIEKANLKAKENGFAFTFLIPANDSLINYYSARGYNKAMYRVEDRYTEIHDFKKDYLSSISKEDERIYKLKEKYYNSLSTQLLQSDSENCIIEIINYIEKSEKSVTEYTTILHTAKDIRNIIKDNKISNGEIAICRNSEGEMVGVAFITFDDRKRIIIPKIFYDDNSILYRLLEFIKNKYSQCALSMYCYPEQTDRRALWMKNYGAANPDGVPGGAYGVAERVYNVSSHAITYGMIRVLDIREILIFLANGRSDLNFSILVKEDSDKNFLLKCNVINGESQFAEEDESKLKQSKNLSALKQKELLELIFRKKDSNNIIMEAFGIPRLPINMSLLLD